MPFTNRKFGVEIECFGLMPNDIVHALTAINVGCVNSEYNHRRTQTWKIVTDGSISPPDGNYESACELVSPVLSGTTGLEEVKKVAKAITEAGAKVNRSCGLHVHVDASGFDTLDLVNVLRRYAKYETVIDSFMPVSRRENRNTFCRSVTDLASTCIRNLGDNYFNHGNPRDFIYRILEDNRYYKVNLMAYIRHGTVEFRQHSGTVNHNKIVNWIKFCVNFVEQSKLNIDSSSQESTYISVATNEVPALVNTTTPTCSRNRRLRADVVERYSMIHSLIQEGPRTMSALMAYTGLTLQGIRGALTNMALWYGVVYTTSPDRGRRISILRRSDTVFTESQILNWQQRNLSTRHSRDVARETACYYQSLTTPSNSISRVLPELRSDDSWALGLMPRVAAFFENRRNSLSAPSSRNARRSQAHT